MINRPFFFEHVRAHLFTGKLTAKQVSGLNFILDVWETNHAAQDDRWLAYALGTAFHETAYTLQPIHEYGGKAYFFKRYDKDGRKPLPNSVATALGNTKAGDGILFHGRGYVQLTGRANYTAMGEVFSIDLTSNSTAADKVLSPQLAAEIMFYGMINGSFTTKSLRQYFNTASADWRNARRIINGLDCADKIAQYAKTFYAAISYTN